MNKASPEDRILDGRLWNDFCDELKKLGQVVFREEAPGDVFNRAQGFRYLTRLLRGGLESRVDYADPQYPAFFRLADETKGVLNNNPDNHYQNCNIDGRFDYRIRGTRGTVPWFSVGTKASPNVEGMRSTGEIDSSQMEFEPDGSFEIIISQKQPAGKNWLPSTADTRMAIVRQTFGDRSKEEIAQLSIECLNPERENNTLDPQQLEGQLQAALAYVRTTANLGINWMETYRKTTLNQLPMHDQALLQAAGGDPTITYYQSYWKLAPDEALLVHIRDLPECATWNLQLANYWMECLDYRFFQISVNKFTAHYEDDGSVKIAIAHRDPGPKYPNWLNTLGHDQGGMLGRYVSAKSKPKEMPARVVKFSEL